MKGLTCIPVLLSSNVFVEKFTLFFLENQAQMCIFHFKNFPKLCI